MPRRPHLRPGGGPAGGGGQAPDGPGRRAVSREGPPAPEDGPGADPRRPARRRSGRSTSRATPTCGASPASSVRGRAHCRPGQTFSPTSATAVRILAADTKKEDVREMSSSRTRGPKAGARLRLERLEDRTAPAAYALPATSSFQLLLTGDGNASASPPHVNHGVSDLVNGRFASVSAPGRGGTLPEAVVVADFDGDGAPDLAVARKDAQDVLVLLREENGEVKDQLRFPTGRAGLDVLFVHDYNRDGRLDLAGVDFEYNDLFVLLGNGDGTFSTPLRIANNELFLALPPGAGNDREEALFAAAIGPSLPPTGGDAANLPSRVLFGRGPAAGPLQPGRGGRRRAEFPPPPVRSRPRPPSFGVVVGWVRVERIDGCRLPTSLWSTGRVSQPRWKFPPWRGESPEGRRRAWAVMRRDYFPSSRSLRGGRTRRERRAGPIEWSSRKTPRSMHPP